MNPGAARPGGRRLVLLRHAKAEAAGGMVDALRPLALTGRRQCLDVGARLVATGLVPEHVLVSSAVRTRQTWELVRGALGDVPAAEVAVLDELYGAGVQDLLELVRAVDERVVTVLVVGHEPTMSSAAAALAATGHDHSHAGRVDQVRAGLPTGAYAVLEVAEWAELDRRTARVVDVVRPPR
ncbi:MAG TPA: histidine phosphatase family protein [Actinotalea sp.]|nr:histidine phosphatase family protein [Actinotalea sp.]